MGSVAAQPEGIPPPAEQQPKRLPGLWIICVLYGLAGMVNLSLLFLATSLGMAVFGGLAALCFVLAIGLWLRSNAARLAAMVVLALACGVAASHPLPAQSKVERALPAIVGLCVAVPVLAYLWLRRRHFRAPAPHRPPSASVSAATGALVLLLGAAWILSLTVDDAARSFPALELAPQPVREEENAYPVLKEMMGRGPLAKAGEVGDLLDEAHDGGVGLSAEWRTQARQALEANVDLLGKVDQMLGRKAVEPPVPRTYEEAAAGYMDWLVYCRVLARLLSLQARVEAAEERPQEALNAADRAALLGLLLRNRGASLLSYLTGDGILSMALEDLPKAASVRGAVPRELLERARSLADENALRDGTVRALGQEFARERLTLELIKATPDGETVRPWYDFVSSCSAVLLRDGYPFLKVNMTMNLEGDCLTESLGRLARYRPEDTPSRGGPSPPFSTLALIRQVGLIAFLRNPHGADLAAWFEQAVPRVPRVHFRGLAEARLTQVFLAARCYQLENGSLPKTLDELAPKYIPEVPADPFSEKPFIYEPDAAPPRLLSVGPDQRPDAAGAEEKDDIVLELAFPSP